MDWFGFCWESFISRWFMTIKLTVPIGYVLDNLYERLRYLAGVRWISITKPHNHFGFVGIEMDHALVDLFFPIEKKRS